MKKLLLGVILLAALVAVSYIKTTRESEREAQAYVDGRESGVREVRLEQVNNDSLIDLLDQKATELVELRAAMIDTLAVRDQVLAHTMDSLTSQIQAGQKDIAELEQRLAADSQASKSGPKKSKSVSAQADHRQILSHYKLAMAKLPADLSAYEYRVAVAEVKSETATRYGITVARLDEIRDAHNLEY